MTVEIPTSLALARIQRTLDAIATRLRVYASDAELDGPKGDMTVPFALRGWKGESVNGKRFSECPPEALEMLADAFESFARKAAAEKKLDTKQRPVAEYERYRAALARGWAERLRRRAEEEF